MATATNGKRPKITSDLVFNSLMRTNYSTSAGINSLLLRTPSRLDPPDRDLDRECGYPRDPDVRQYKALYDRVGIAARVVNIWPDECWAAYPELYRSEKPIEHRFEKAWKLLARRTLPWHYLHRVDRLSGIGQYGILLLGLSDGRDLRLPAAGLDARTGLPVPERTPLDLLYLRAFDQSVVKVEETETDVSSPRFGQPTLYHIYFADPSGLVNVESKLVHWTRVIHVSDNRECSEIYGVPRMRAVLNNVYDIRKVSGSSAEMFWKGGFPGYAFETWPDLAGEAAVDEDAMREEMEAFQNGLQRYLSSVGGTWKSLQIQIADPSNHLTQQLTLLCATIGVPLRIFLGTESGHLASTQDAGTWKERLRGRQLNYLEPMVVRPFVDRLMALGCLPQVEEYLIAWRDLQTLGDKDRADVGLKRVQALMQYVTGNVQTVMPLRLLLTLVIGFSEPEADTIVELLESQDHVKDGKLVPPPLPPAPANTGGSGGRVGNPARRPNGRPSGRVEGRS